MLAGRRQPVFGRALDVAFHKRFLRWMTILAVSPGFLKVVDGRVDHDAARVLRPNLFAGNSDEVRQLAQTKKHLDDGTLYAPVFHPLNQLLWQVLLPDHAEVGAVRVRIGEDDIGLEVAPVVSMDTARRAVEDLDFSYFGVRQDLGAVRLCGGSEGFSHGAHAAADESPGTLMAVYGAEYVVELHVGGARRAGAGVRADYTPGGERCFYLFGLEILVEDFCDAFLCQGAPVFFSLCAVEGLFDVCLARSWTVHERPHPADYAFPQHPVRIVGGGVFCGELRDLLLCLGFAEVEHDVPAIGERGE